jgi:surfeit locus 1 family protein
MKRWPIIPTMIVIIAVGIMIGLGVWQLQRKAEKEALLARYNAADGLPAIAWPVVPDPKALPLFRRSTVMCGKVTKIESVSGSNRAGDAGFAHVASCQTGGAEGVNAKVAIGWSERPTGPRHHRARWGAVD